MLVETLQPLLAPVVLISACGLMIMALNARTMTAKARIRQLHLERLTITENAAQVGSASATQRLRYEGVGNQSDNLLRRLVLMRAALMSMVGCVVLMLVSSLLTGLHGVLEITSIPAVTIFVLGVLSMLAGAVVFLMELRLSMREIAYEHRRIMALTLPGDDEGAVP